MSIVSIISSLLGCFCCCLFWVFVILLVWGLLRLRKKGKTDAGVKDMLNEGYEASRAFVRGGKTREQILAEEDEEENRRR
jgi:hypothetical protein